MKDTPAAQNAEGAPSGEQTELENLYVALNGLLAENELLEQKNLELQEEMNACVCAMTGTRKNLGNMRCLNLPAI